MSHIPRIGIQIGPGDPFWVQVHEVIWQRAQTLAVDLVEIAVQRAEFFSLDEQVEVIEDFIVQEIDVLICNTYPASLLTSILDRGIPIVYVSEIAIHHPRFVSRSGLYDAAYMLGTFFAAQLSEGSTILVIGGHMGDDDSQSRLEGFYAALPADKQYRIHHVPSPWIYEHARPRVLAYLSEHAELQIDAIFGLSDSLALAARDTLQARGYVHGHPLIVGINGDPLALVAIADGSMTATVETDVDDIAAQAVDLAYRAACGELLPPHFRNLQRLVTVDTVADATRRKLVSLANLPTRFVGVNRRNEQRRVVQLETSLAIDRQLGLILDEQQLSLTITGLIRDNYGFDYAQFLTWNPTVGKLVPIDALQHASAAASGFLIDSSGPLAYVLSHNRTVFIPDMRASQRFAPDPLWPEMQARVVVPVHLGGQIMGVLDLHHSRTAHHTREEIDGLQLLADQLGISMRNAELYGEALAARAAAEKADRLKTGLLANISHELRTPLNVILGYSRTTLDALASGKVLSADELAEDTTRIYRSGEHLLRLINDLLDLSRAEIDELELLPEQLNTRDFLKDVFRSSADYFGGSGAVMWQLELPPALPVIDADPVRIRQVLLNLLHNAHKFTPKGQITLGAEVAPPDLHCWVTDTGIGIPSELQEQIFEPFVSADARARRHEGIGLGLSIARRLVALHHGRLTLESQPGHGSTFHLYLPLPTPSEPFKLNPVDNQPVLLLISDAATPPTALVEFVAQRGMALCQLRSNDDIGRFLETTPPTLLTWDLANAHVDSGRFARQLRAHAALHHIPILLYHQELNAVDNPAGIATGLLLKPLTEHALIEAVADLGSRTSEGRILIVEDDLHTRALHRRIITEHFPNYVVDDVANGRAALDILARETPSLVVLDLIMPELDGFGVLAALRASPRTAMVPVLVLSGLALTPNDIQRLAEARVIFQTKDVLSENELAESLRRTLTHDAPLPLHTSAMVKQALAFIQQHYGEALLRQDIAGAIGVNKDYLGRIFHQEIGLSPWEYLIRYRVLRAKELLHTTSYTVAEVAARVGFDTATYFSHIFRREVGCSPREFRARPASDD